MIPSIWTGLYHRLPLDQSLRRLHACGWQAFETSTEHLEMIEAADDPEGTVARAREYLEAHGLAMPQAHARLRANVASPDRETRREDIRRLCLHIHLAARMGVTVHTVHPGKVGEEATPEELARVRRLNVEAFRRLGDHAAAHGGRIGIENMVYPGARTAADLLDLLDAVAHPAVGIVLDTSHANVAGIDLPAAIRALAPHLVGTHISDNDGSGDQHRAPGGGNIAWDAVVAAFREVGYDGLFNLEIPGERPVDEAAMPERVRQALAATLVVLGHQQESDDVPSV